MTYIYVLVSSPDDYYYEQALMSVTSLRIYMPKARLVLLADNKTVSGFTGKRVALKKLVTEIITVPFADTVQKTERSRLIKTSIPDYIDGPFLYIDCDTIICDDLSAIRDYGYELAGVLDCHVFLNDHIHKDYFLERDRRLGFSGTKAAGYNINGGLLYAENNDLTKRFFTAWNDAWRYSAYRKHDFHDQSALNQANYLTGLKIKLLPGEWNCQPAHGGLAFLGSAKIVHYFSSEFKASNYIPYYKLADVQLQQRIKESGSIPADILQMIQQPKFQFNKVQLISDQRIVSIMQSPLLFTLADLKTHAAPVFKFLERQTKFFRKLGKLLAHTTS
ncbi:MAG: glycosyl transferase [Treponema sp.]|jgi:lipopolysaccharide biosynthesis glycosyltransferase|nr:glycosyl transferase [Treponema sp.]